MLIINQLRMNVGHAPDALRAAIARSLRLPESAIKSWRVDQRAIDARRGRVEFSYSVLAEVDNEAAVVSRLGDNRISIAADETYRQLEGVKSVPDKRVVIIGTGPCGLFCGLILARQGMKPVLIERGKPATDRARDVTGFWKRGWALDPNSNVQFGEGGAGTFSDGKLYTQIRDREHRIPWMLRELVKAGAPEDIITNNRPHIGTDRLIKVVRTMREEIQSRGGDVRFGAQVTDLEITDGTVKGVKLSDGTSIPADIVVLAIGHSSRDTFEVLHRLGVPMESKPFAVGVRIEHPQKMVDQTQYQKLAGHPELGAAAYRFVAHCQDNRTAYSFCMCPGGLVVAATSEANQVVTNGMSSYARAEANANSGFMVELRPEDFPGDSPLAGIELQRDLERRAFELGGSNYFAPAQLLGDFMRGRPSTGPGRVQPSYQPGVKWTDVSLCLPPVVTKVLREALPIVDRQIPGFAMEDAVLTAIETRSSSPVRVLRDPVTMESTGIHGLYPAGEGAGYAGGIVSAAVDGIRVAERILLGDAVPAA